MLLNGRTKGIVLYLPPLPSGYLPLSSYIFPTCEWLDEQGYREGMSPDFNMDEPTETDFPALIKDKTEKWLATRQAVAQYLDDKKGKGQSYDLLTADIHACIIGKLKPLVQMAQV